MLASRTGGNKFFSEFDSGIALYDNKEQAIELLCDLLQSPNKVSTMGEKNRLLFESSFTDGKFAEKYISFLKTI